MQELLNKQKKRRSIVFLQAVNQHINLVSHDSQNLRVKIKPANYRK